MLDVHSSPLSDLKTVWRNLHSHSCPFDYNFHLHTTRSDGQLEPGEIMEQALDHGLKGLAITDHHCTDAYQEALDWLNTQGIHSDRLTLWTGIEISADLLGVEVHILGYGFDLAAPSLFAYSQRKNVRNSPFYDAAIVIDQIHQAGGLAVLAHPERYRKSSKLLVPAAVEFGIDGIEVFYNYQRTDPWQATPKKASKLERMAKAYNLFSTCGTDTHGKDILLRI
ncbi:MAG: PHP domain-containing protein [Synechococcaceae cyanobacterium RL_1_2]|nr:PHP domain-containing protein [Synechococcaceae cyanobacterium RL_1_2]